MFIRLTDSAIAAISSALIERGEGIGIRLDVSISGPSGMSYRMEFADESLEGELCVEQGGVRVMTDMKNLAYLQGLLLDYISLGNERGFRIRHAEECGTCGCGRDACE